MQRSSRIITRLNTARQSKVKSDDAASLLAFAVHNILNIILHTVDNAKERCEEPGLLFLNRSSLLIVCRTQETRLIDLIKSYIKYH